MSKLEKTLEDLIETRIKFVLTRFDQTKEMHDDLDILIKKKDFGKFIEELEQAGYSVSSHDQALGGRIKGAQKNLTKNNRIKVDLHKDLTWRADRYLDLDMIWWNLRKKKIAGHMVLIPEKKIDAFLVLINVIFEKGYITRDEYDLMWPELKRIINEKDLKLQAKKYGWKNTYRRFLNWTKKNGELKNFPIFLPASLIVFSYLEKIIKRRRFHITSFLYYFFFRTRYFFNKQLPYD